MWWPYQSNFVVWNDEVKKGRMLLSPHYLLLSRDYRHVNHDKNMQWIQKKKKKKRMRSESDF